MRDSYYYGKSIVTKDPYMVDPDWNPTEEEIYQKMIDAVGEDLEIYGPKEVQEYKESWVCSDWQDWIMKKTWGIGYGYGKGLHYARKIKDFSKARCGDIVHMQAYGEPHVCRVVKNYHDGRLMLTSYSCSTFHIGYSDEEYEELCEDLGDAQYGLSIVPYDCIDSIYTLYKD